MSQLSPEDRNLLLHLARRGVESAISGRRPPVPDPVEGVLAEHRGCFVTLTNQGRLRGCIGTFHPTQPLARAVGHMAKEACRDGRFVFDPITPAELDALTIEVSVLGPLEPAADPLALEIGTHGVYVMTEQGAGCFLPEVATDMGWDAREFLSQCCIHKAGLAADAWRRPETRVFLFTSEKFAR